MSRQLRPRCPICHFRQKDLPSHQRKCEAAHRHFRKTWPKTTSAPVADRLTRSGNGRIPKTCAFCNGTGTVPFPAGMYRRSGRGGGKRLDERQRCRPCGGHGQIWVRSGT